MVIILTVLQKSEDTVIAWPHCMQVHNITKRRFVGWNYGGGNLLIENQRTTH